MTDSTRKSIIGALSVNAITSVLSISIFLIYVLFLYIIFYIIYNVNTYLAIIIETQTAGTLKEHLEKWDYKVRCAKDFRNITEEFAGFSPELVVMDILLPFYNGYHWCTEIRKISKVPILFLSSAGDNMNIVMAMNMGG